MRARYGYLTKAFLPGIAFLVCVFSCVAGESGTPGWLRELANPAIGIEAKARILNLSTLKLKNLDALLAILPNWDAEHYDLLVRKAGSADRERTLAAVCALIPRLHSDTVRCKNLTETALSELSYLDAPMFWRKTKARLADAYLLALKDADRGKFGELLALERLPIFCATAPMEYMELLVARLQDDAGAVVTQIGRSSALQAHLREKQIDGLVDCFEAMKQESKPAVADIIRRVLHEESNSQFSPETHLAAAKAWWIEHRNNPAINTIALREIQNGKSEETRAFALMQLKPRLLAPAELSKAMGIWQTLIADAKADADLRADSLFLLCSQRGLMNEKQTAEFQGAIRAMLAGDADTACMALDCMIEFPPLLSEGRLEDALVKLIEDPASASSVKDRAAYVLGRNSKRRDLGAILLKYLEETQLHGNNAVHALRAATGKDLGQNAAAWAAWFKKEELAQNEAPAGDPLPPQAGWSIRLKTMAAERGTRFNDREEPQYVTGTIRFGFAVVAPPDQIALQYDNMRITDVYFSDDENLAKNGTVLSPNGAINLWTSLRNPETTGSEFSVGLRPLQPAADLAELAQLKGKVTILAGEKPYLVLLKSLPSQAGKPIEQEGLKGMEFKMDSIAENSIQFSMREAPGALPIKSMYLMPKNEGENRIEKIERVQSDHPKRMAFQATLLKKLDANDALGIELFESLQSVEIPIQFNAPKKSSEAVKQPQF